MSLQGSPGRSKNIQEETVDKMQKEMEVGYDVIMWRKRKHFTYEVFITSFVMSCDKQERIPFVEYVSRYFVSVCVFFLLSSLIVYLKYGASSTNLSKKKRKKIK